jgi:hypothetical protein
MKFVWLAVTVITLTGCATISAADCQNSYDVGFRDAIFGLQRQEAIYVPVCSSNGVQLDAERYALGWQEGKYEFDRRKAHGGVD